MAKSPVVHKHDIFNSLWYLAPNSDIAESGADPWQHFLQHGLAEVCWQCELPASTFGQQL